MITNFNCINLVLIFNSNHFNIIDLLFVRYIVTRMVCTQDCNRVVTGMYLFVSCVVEC